MSALNDSLLAALNGLALVTLLGYGPARWLLPQAFRPWFWLAVPVVGLSVAAVALGWLSIFFPIRTAVPALLVLAVASTLGIRRAPGIGPQAWREQAAVGLFSLAGLSVALAPLWGRPDLLSIGPNWDIEIYLPMAEYLKDHPTGFSLADPAGFPFPGEANPLLWRVNFFDPRWAGLTFAQFHAATGVLAGQGAHQGLPGLLALMHALSVPAAFLLCRAAFRLPSGVCLAAAGLLAVNPAALHIVFWSFGQQASSLPLLPWALACAMSAVGERSSADTPSRLRGAFTLFAPLRMSGGVALSGLALAALLAAFVPAAVIYVVAIGLLLGLGAAAGLGQTSKAGDKPPPYEEGQPGQRVSPLEKGERARPPVAGTLGIVALSLVLAPWAYLRGIWRGWHFLEERGIAGLTVGPDVAEFPPLGWAFGLFPTPEHGLLGLLEPHSLASAIVATAVRLTVVAGIGLGLYFAARSRNYPLLACGAACIALLLALRYLAPYPYGYLKLLAASAFLLPSIFLAGLWAAPRLPAAGKSALVTALVLANLVGLAVLLPETASQSRMAFRELQGLQDAVSPGASVLVSGHPDYQGPASGAVAYFLRHAQLYGYVATGFSTFYRLREDGVYDYALYHEHDPIPAELHGGVAAIWEGRGLRLYRRNAGLVFLRELGGNPPVVERTAGQGRAAGLRITDWTEEGYPEFTGWSPPGMGVLAMTTRPEARFPDIGNREAFTLSAPAPPRGGDRRTAVRSSPVPAGLYVGTVTMGAFHAQEITVMVNGEARPLSLRPGVGVYSIGALGLPASLEVHNALEAPVYVKSLAVYQAQAPSAGTLQDASLVRWTASRINEAASISLDYVGPRYRAAFDVYGLDGGHYGDWLLPASLQNGDWSLHLVLEVMARRLSPLGAATNPRLSTGPPEDGPYRAMLVLRDGDRLVRKVTLFEFTLEGGRLTEVRGGGKGVFMG